MRTQLENQMKRMAALASVMVVAVAEAMAQDKQAATARHIVVSIPDRKLAIMKGDTVVKVYPTAVGAPASPTPAGSYTVVERLTDPTWYGPGQIVAPGKNNPLGPRWIGLSLAGYGIHGTNNAGSIGHNASHGCIRMRNQDVKELFEIVAVGDSVELVGERTPELAKIFGTDTLTQSVTVKSQSQTQE